MPGIRNGVLTLPPPKSLRYLIEEEWIAKAQAVGKVCVERFPYFFLSQWRCSFISRCALDSLYSCVVHVLAM